MTKLVKSMINYDYNCIHSALVKWGYASKVMVDEMQAFLATGLSPMKGVGDIDRTEFKKVFKNKLKSVKLK